MTDCCFDTMLPQHLLVTCSLHLPAPSPLSPGTLSTTYSRIPLRPPRVEDTHRQYSASLSDPLFTSTTLSLLHRSSYLHHGTTPSAPALLSCAHHRSIDPPSYLCSLPLAVIGSTVGAQLHPRAIPSLAAS